MLPWESTPQTWSPILTELIGIKNFLNNKILSLRPCRRPLWQTQASRLLPWRLDNILIASVACCVLLFIFALLVLSVGVFAVSLVSGFHAEAQAWVLLSFHDLRNSFFEFFLVVQERSLFISISRLFFLLAPESKFEWLGLETTHLTQQALQKSTFADLGFLAIPG